jgi:hypothetical protein
MRPPRKQKLPPLVITVRERTPNAIPGVDPPAPESLWHGQALLVTFGWQKGKEYHTAIGKVRRSPAELRALIGPKQWAKFLQGKRAFITHDQALRDWAWLAGVV